MPFNIQPIREFVVRPALPRQLSRMSELAYNILWAWEPAIRALFRRLDPALRKESGYNPVVMLGRVSQTALERAANDPRYMALYQLACQRFDMHMSTGEFSIIAVGVPAILLHVQGNGLLPVGCRTDRQH